MNLVLLIAGCLVFIQPSYTMCPRDCICKDMTVACSDQKLKHVPHFLNPRILSLDLSETGIARLDNGLDFYTHLIHLNISFSKLQNLGENQFSNLEVLRDLQLEFNLVEELTLGSFTGLHNLETLNLKGNKIRSIHNQAFSGLNSLEQLDLSENELKKISGDTFLSLRSLDTLTISKNQIQRMQSARFPRCRVLNLSQNQISRLEPDAVVSSEIQELDLSDNFLSVMEPTSLSGCMIEKLDISYNKLVNVPQLSVAGQVTDMLLSGNMIRSISSSSLMNYESLRNLHLNNMPVMDAIQAYSLDNNLNLTYLTLANSKKLSPIPDDLFIKLEKLRVLDLSRLNWRHLHPGQIPPRVQSLRLGGTQLACSCSLSWLVRLEQSKPVLVEGATCDGVSLLQVPREKFECSQQDYILIIGIVCGAVLILLVLVVLVAVFSWCSTHRSKYPCDYLQYVPCEEEKQGYPGGQQGYPAGQPGSHQDIKYPGDQDPGYPGQQSGYQQHDGQEMYVDPTGMQFVDSSLQYAEPTTTLGSPYRTGGRITANTMHPALYSGGTTSIPGMYEHFGVSNLNEVTRFQQLNQQPLYYENPSSTIMERKFAPSTLNKFTNENIYEDGFSINTRLREKVRYSPKQYKSTTSPYMTSTATEPLYCTVTTNPLDEYSSGYHGSGSLYTDSSASSTGSTAQQLSAQGIQSVQPVLPTQSPPLLGRMQPGGMGAEGLGAGGVGVGAGGLGAGRLGSVKCGSTAVKLSSPLDATS